MKNTTLQFLVPRKRRRAVELYSADTPFRARQERNRKSYQRRDKHQVRQDWF
jgi:stalled ribosome alternative rescue factor ArfA